MEEEKLEFGMTKLIIDDDKPQPITDNINIEEEFLKPTKLAYEEDQKNYLATTVESLEIVGEVNETTTEDKIIKTSTYKAKEKENDKYSMYILSVVTFKSEPDYVLYIFEQVGEKNYSKYKSELENIVKEVKLK